MTLPVSPIVISNTPLNQSEKRVQGEYLTLAGEVYYRIKDFDAMEPFFISVVSSSDHWLFIASSGGLSAGRVSAEQALFPYYTVDKLTENSENTGSKAILLVRRPIRRACGSHFPTGSGAFMPLPAISTRTSPERRWSSKRSISISA